MNAHQQLAIQALENMRGDDLHRFRSKFKNMTAEEMKLEWGYSGQTRAEIIQGCEEYNMKIEAAINWIKTL